MTNVVQDAAMALETALKTLPGFRLYRLGENIDPPGIVVGPPKLDWTSFCGDPTEATFSVFLIEAMDDRSLERLWEHVAPVSVAVDSVQDAVVRSATPGIYEAGATKLPCYVLSVEVSL
jgi:hypothetical protein